MKSIYINTIKQIASYFPAVIPHLSLKARMLIPIKADLSSINAEYHDQITDAIVAYFEGGGIALSRNQFKEAIIQAFGDSFDAGWVDAGGELPVDDDALAWVEDRINQEFGYINDLFQEIRDLRKDKDFDYFSWASSKADAYTKTLAYIYNFAQLMINKKQMLTWRLGETEKHCKICLNLDGQRHKASWYISKDYIPRKPDAAMDCKGYNCDCSLEDDEGNEVTI